MLRRKFLGALTLLGASGLASVATLEANKDSNKSAAHHREAMTVTYAIQGFTCITCAVGLETLLLREKGVLSVKASYSKADAVIEFDPKIVTEASIKSYIHDAGFTARDA
jgi:Cu+-exporting ATPase